MDKEERLAVKIVIGEGYRARVIPPWGPDLTDERQEALWKRISTSLKGEHSNDED